MKILVISQYFYPEQFRINDIVTELVKRKHDVTVLAGIPNYPEGKIFQGYEDSYKKIEKHNGIKIIRCNNRPRHKGIINLIINYISYVRCANKYIKSFKEQFDVVYVYEVSPITMAIPAIKIKKMQNIPMYIYCLDLWPESAREYRQGKILSEHGFIFKIIKFISSKIYCSADSIGITSPSFKEYLVNVCKVDEEHIHYLPQHSDDIAQDEDLTATDSEYINIFYMGNVGIAQNIKQIVDAVEKIKNLNGFKIHIVGSGSMLSFMKKYVNERGLKNKFVFYGKRPYSEMKKYYKMANACLLTLSSQTKIGLTIPGKLQNYMAAGKPIIASIDGDSVEIINTSKSGICVCADNSDELAKAIFEFVNNYDKYLVCGQNARKYYKENFTLETHVRKLEEELQKLI